MWFESSLCVVQSITFTKGGSDNSWTIDGLPQEIDVTVTIKELYPTMSITNKYNMMRYNIGLSSFLDTLAGIRTDQVDVFARAKSWVKTRLSVPARLVDNIENTVSGWKYQIDQGLYDKFLK